MEDSNRFDLSVIFETAKRVITNPTEFYQSMAATGGYGNPVVFVVVVGLAGGLIGSVWALMGAGPAAGIASGVATVVLLPIFLVLGSFIAGLVLFVVWKLMGSTYGYETAYRCVAFSMAILPVVAIANLIPYLGQILQTVWACWLMYIASIHVHKISEGTAKTVLAVLAGVLLIINITSEYQARKFKAMAQAYQEKLSAVNPLGENMDASEMGKVATGFLTGLQEGSGGKALTAEQKSELEQAGAAMGKMVESMQQTARELENKNPEDITAQDAGAAMGALFGALQKAAESMPGQDANSQLLATQAPPLTSFNVEQLATLGVISKPSRSHAIQFTVNDGTRFAPVSDDVKVYRDSGGIRYRIFLESAYLKEFSSLGDGGSTMQTSSASDSAASDGNDTSGISPEQNIVVNNAGIHVYDRDGVVIAGDECRQSVLQIGAQNSTQASNSKQGLWLWCPESERSRTAQ